MEALPNYSSAKISETSVIFFFFLSGAIPSAEAGRCARTENHTADEVSRSRAAKELCGSGLSLKLTMPSRFPQLSKESPLHCFED